MLRTAQSAAQCSPLFSLSLRTSPLGRTSPPGRTILSPVLSYADPRIFPVPDSHRSAPGFIHHFLQFCFPSLGHRVLSCLHTVGRKLLSCCREMLPQQ